MSPAEPAPTVPTGSTGSNETINLACPYCTSPMDPPGFTPWPLEPRLITGECVGCGRSVTLPTTWLAGSRVPLQR
jgi:hypothetical protein